MLRYSLIVFCILLSKLANCQLTNLVPNGSFEDCTKTGDPLTCPDSSRYILNEWYKATDGNYRYFNALNQCDTTPWGQVVYGAPANYRGIQIPKDGIAYCMIQTYYDSTLLSNGGYSYLQIKLLNQLIINNKYCFSFYISLPECHYYSTYRSGGYFSDSAIHRNDAFPIDYYNPQIENCAGCYPNKTNWILVSGSFISNGTEEYLTIGNFHYQSTTPMIPTIITDYLCSPLFYNSIDIYIDDVSLYDCTGFYYEAEAGENTSLCKGEEIMLGWDENTARTFNWSVVSGDSASLLNDSIPRPTVSPQQSTVYALYVVDEYVQEHFDTVTIEVVDCENPIYVPNIFSPNNDGQNDVLYVRSVYVQELKAFKIYDRWGQEIFQCHAERSRSTALEDCGWDGTYRGKEAPTAVYTYYVEAVLLNGETVVKRGNVTLVR